MYIATTLSGSPLGSNMTDKGGVEHRLSYAIPHKAKKEDRNSSYFVQGRKVGNGHEVAHAKACHYAGVELSPDCVVGEDEYLSGFFVSQYGANDGNLILNQGFRSILYSYSYSRGQANVTLRIVYDTGEDGSSGNFKPDEIFITARFDGKSFYSDRYEPVSVKEEFRGHFRYFYSRYPEILTSTWTFQHAEECATWWINPMLTMADRYQHDAVKRFWYHPVKNPTYQFPSFEFVLDEPNTLLGDAPILLPFGAYHLKALRQEAYLAALDSAPRLNDNTISNVLEIVSLIKDVISGAGIKVPADLADLWLSYRYNVMTTKADAEEALSYLKRTRVDLSAGFRCYGQANGRISSDVSAVVKCGVSLKPKVYTYLETMRKKVVELGVSPDLYIIWDLVPYSFIVDWFIPVGDILHGYDLDYMYNRDYQIENIWYSLTYDRGTTHYYTRWSEQSTPDVSGFYTIDTVGTPSDRVKGFRILDALSLMYRR
jgi:hypothetical protein